MNKLKMVYKRFTKFFFNLIAVKLICYQMYLLTIASLFLRYIFK